MHFERGFRRRWNPHFVVARWEYGVFVPAELEGYACWAKGCLTEVWLAWVPLQKSIHKRGP